MGTVHTFEVALPPEAVELIDRLLKTGLFGASREDVCARLIEQGLERRFFVEEPFR